MDSVCCLQAIASEAIHKMWRLVKITWIASLAAFLATRNDKNEVSVWSTLWNFAYILALLYSGLYIHLVEIC